MSDVNTNQEPEIDSILYTTVCIDIYGKVYDLSYEHPSWEQKKKSGGKESVFEKCIVKNAFTCPVEECERLKKKSKK